MTIDLRSAAKKNQEYYLVEKEVDNEDRWFRYIKTMESYSEPVLISPEMAKEILKAEDDLRKPVDPRIVEAAARELNSEFHKTIAISFSGKLLDGRLVLEAICLNNQSAIVFISFNVSDKLSFLFG
jgi:hypothetical protein